MAGVAESQSLLQNVVVRYSVLPVDGQNAFEAAHVEGVQTTLLSQVYGPCLIAIEESVEDAGLMDAHISVLCEHPVVPHPFRKLSFSVRVDLCVKRQVGRDGAGDIGVNYYSCGNRICCNC